MNDPQLTRLYPAPPAATPPPAAEVLARPAAQHALAVAAATYPDWLLAHCTRSLTLAVLLADAHDLEVDPDVLAVAVLLHDLGLVPALHSPTTRFEVVSADLARTHALRAGLDRAQAEQVWDAVALHGTGGIAQHKSPNTHAAYLAIAADVVGDGLDTLDPTTVAEVMTTRPGFAELFLNALRADLQDKPATAAFTWMNDLSEPPAGGLPPFPTLVTAHPYQTDSLERAPR